jgi:hypothetical protein
MRAPLKIFCGITGYTPPHPFPLTFSRTVLTRVRWRDDRLGLKVAIADINVETLGALAKELSGTYGESNVLAVTVDVSKLEDVVHLRDRVYEAWGEVSVVRGELPTLSKGKRGREGETPHRGAFPCPHPLS